MNELNHLRRRILDAIRSWDPLHDDSAWTGDKFDELALAVFALQFAHNQPYRRFCEGRGVNPDRVQSYRDIPAVPTDAFKYVALTVTQRPARVFRTSGTTSTGRGEHYFGDLSAYRASLRGPFRRYMLPDREKMRLLIAAPDPKDLDDSSLSFMLGELVEHHGDEGSEFFVRQAAGQLSLDLDGLARVLSQAEAHGEPVCLLGTAFAWAELFEASDRTWSLPAGSRLMETGGFKGKARELTRAELYDAFKVRLGLPPAMCVSEYSMTELSSQAYTGDLRRHRMSATPDDDRRAILRVPPWVRIDIVDPRTLDPIDDSAARGLIRWYDLANLESVLGVQTSDIGRRRDGGFILEGRALGAELRGCSLTIEEIVRGVDAPS